jgi:TonB family protein
MAVLASVTIFAGGPLAQNAVPASAPPTSSLPPCKEPRAVPEPEHMTRPKYPKESLKAGSDGSVELRALVDSNGKTRELKLVKGEPVFAKPAIEAVRRWQFHPALTQAKPVETAYRVQIRFVLVLREAIPDWEIESPQDRAEAFQSASTNFERGTPDGPVYRMSEGQGVTAPKQVYAPEPEFSEKARQAGEQGTVTLSLIVGTDGKPRDLTVSCSSAPDLNENALDAVKSWRFEPGTKQGKPVVVEISVEV